jgi:hypothetical protein
MQCTLKRCQGKRGCVCPKGSVPVGCYAGRQSEADLAAGSSPSKLGEKLPGIRSSPNTKPTNAPLNKNGKAPSFLPKLQQNSSNDSHRRNIDIQPAQIGSSFQASQGPDVPKPSGVSGTLANGMNGEVVIRYNHYKKKFPVSDGSTTSVAVDEEYFLSFAFPKSKIHITLYGPSDFSFEALGLTARPVLTESPEGTYWGLDPSKEYWVEIEEDPAERKAYEIRQDELAKQSAAQRALEEDRCQDSNMIVKVKVESCSCIEGNPCLDRYACKDWEHRYDVAKRNGWKGFQ